METTETEVALEPSNTQIIKEVAMRAAAGAIVAVVVTQLATFAVNKAVEKYQARKARKTVTTEQ